MDTTKPAPPPRPRRMVTREDRAAITAAVAVISTLRQHRPSSYLARTQDVLAYLGEGNIDGALGLLAELAAEAP